jgi:hypothetical protein
LRNILEVPYRCGHNVKNRHFPYYPDLIIIRFCGCTCPDLKPGGVLLSRWDFNQAK